MHMSYWNSAVCSSDRASRSPSRNHDCHGRFAFGSAAHQYEQFGERGHQQERYREVDRCRMQALEGANDTITVNLLVIMALRGFVGNCGAAHRFHIGTGLSGDSSGYSRTRRLILMLLVTVRGSSSCRGAECQAGEKWENRSEENT